MFCAICNTIPAASVCGSDGDNGDDGDDGDDANGGGGGRGAAAAADLAASSLIAAGVALSDSQPM